MCAAGKNEFLTLFGGISLDDANAAERFSQTPGDLGIDSAALTKQWSQFFEGERHTTSKCRQGEKRNRGKAPVEIEEHAQRDSGGPQSAPPLPPARPRATTEFPRTTRRA